MPQNPRLQNAPSTRMLPADVHMRHHAQHGDVMIERGAKAANAEQVRFTITLRQTNREQPNQGDTLQYKHVMYISDSDGRLEYTDIQMPDGMDGKGIGYFYHYVAALTAAALGVKSFVVHNVAT